MHSPQRNGWRAGMGLALLLLATGARAEHHVRLHWSGDLGVGHDDNVGNAAEDVDARDSAFVAAGVNLDYTRRISLNTGLLLRGGAQGEGYEAVDALSNARVLGMARLSHRPSGGFHAPTLAGWVSAAALEFDSGMRDGFEYRAGVFVAEPLTTAISARLSLAASERRSANEVFDLAAWNAGLNLDWAVLHALTLYGGYQFQDGDLVSSGSVPPKSSHLPGGAGSATAADNDDALDGLFAYRIDATTQVATLGFNVPCSSRVSVDGQLRRIDASAGETGYERWQGIVSVLMRL